ncbi:MAG TPA: multidrug effflux MFS transporter [Vitreimonas sp.]|uniref:multidrug effflux MFS transporter n=1 Tax=Vitreimonas sp. TaxID=3069702 RepID=UPI002D73D1A6|nr:multidrug effflux MFS transporter [Vitreimonas sp.]HYD86678.1 multidrug effflux MFS transporter [Vitreimonas sp.]
MRSPETTAPKALSTLELVAMVAALSALNALAIDIMLPALPDIARDFSLANDNDRQLVVVSYVALFGVSQLVYGPLADTFGRRSVLIYALGIYIVGSVLCVVAPNFELFLAARAMQGVGAAATRVIATAVVRDLTEGRRMAQVMSMAMTVFMIVPIVAPGLGQLILFVAPWRWIFGALLIYALVVLAWALIRLPETLRPEYRAPFRPREIAANYLAVLRERQTVGYMLATTFVTGCLFGYITSSEQIFVDYYDLGAAFPLAFGAIAIAISAGTFLNSRLVVKHGMRRLSHVTLIAFTLIAAVIGALAALGLATFWVFFGLMALAFAMFGLISSNFNALAMEPVGRIAGSASALYGAVSATGGAIAGGLIARAFDGTPAPFALGLALSGLATLVTIVWTERGRLFDASPRLP